MGTVHKREHKKLSAAKPQPDFSPLPLGEAARRAGEGRKICATLRPSPGALVLFVSCSVLLVFVCDLLAKPLGCRRLLAMELFAWRTVFVISH